MDFAFYPAVLLRYNLAAWTYKTYLRTRLSVLHLNHVINKRIGKKREAFSQDLQCNLLLTRLGVQHELPW